MDQPRDAEAGLLQDLLTGARAVDEAAVQALFAVRPDLRERYARLRQLAAALDRTAEQEREQLAQDLRTPSPLESAVRQQVEHQLRPAPRLGPRLLAAALLLLALAATWWTLGARRANRDSLLGPADGSMQVIGDCELFTWRQRLPPGCTFRLLCLEIGTGRILHEVPDLTEPQWRPQPDELRQLPTRMTWVVEIHDVGGNLLPGTLGPALVSRQH